jgi:hypothetical protein
MMQAVRAKRVRHLPSAALVVGILCLSIVPKRALAGPPGSPDDRPASLAVGAGVADRVVNGSGGVAFPLELTLIPAPIIFTSVGAVFSGGGLDHAYVEVGVWLIASLAAGVGYGAYDSPEGRKDGEAFHLFVGVPIPLDLNKLGANEWLPYIEPYYRPSWGPWPGTVHEVGLMVKVSYWFKDVIGKIGG